MTPEELQHIAAIVTAAKDQTLEGVRAAARGIEAAILHANTSAILRETQRSAESSRDALATLATKATGEPSPAAAEALTTARLDAIETMQALHTARLDALEARVRNLEAQSPQ